MRCVRAASHLIIPVLLFERVDGIMEADDISAPLSAPTVHQIEVVSQSLSTTIAYAPIITKTQSAMYFQTAGPHAS